MSSYIRALVLLLVCVVVLLGQLPGQGLGGAWYDCDPPVSNPQPGLVIFGNSSMSAVPNPFLTILTPNQGTVAALELISLAEDGNPWPLDPLAGCLLVNTNPAYWIGSVPMTQSTSGVSWIHRWDFPGDPSLVGEPLFFQVAKVSTSGGWLLSIGLTVTLQP